MLVWETDRRSLTAPLAHSEFDRHGVIEMPAPLTLRRSDQHRESLALAHYQVIRRNGAVLPFEPNKMVEAMMKAFLAVHRTLTNREPGQTLLDWVNFSFERVSVWRCQIRLLALDFKRALLVQGSSVRRHTAPGMQVGAGVGRGFFSATKPNLRNAP